MAGTFNPPHLGHLMLAQTARVQLNLDKVLFMPVGQPTHKVTDQPADVRIELIERSIKGNSGFGLDLSDVERDPPHYTATLMPLMCDRYPGYQISFLIGSDSLNKFPEWHAPLEILNYCRLAVLQRPDHPINWERLNHQLPILKSCVDLLAGPHVYLSSTYIREILQNLTPSPTLDTHPLRYLLEEETLAYIQEHELYT